ncbi:tRNA_pseudouridine38/39 synthase [Hexamita inflata]|uniref:tRNA pseudouridine synthase n=1 Tax=Hexamita inflata TaxID=28002 RepID=A0AA86TNU4_9EUKA|nr:tRNA pseudouridine38/39 synthase [Hexamita inflata]
MNSNYDYMLLQLSKMSRRELTVALARLIKDQNITQTEVLKIIPRMKPISESKPDFLKLNCVKVAIRVQYDGTDFSGLAYQGTEKQALTVENLFIAALQQAYLLPRDMSTLVYQFCRCGRTDTGVSGIDQVFSFYLRCNFDSGLTFGDLIRIFEEKKATWAMRHAARQERLKNFALKKQQELLNENNINDDENSEEESEAETRPHMNGIPADPKFDQLNTNNYIEAINKYLPSSIRATEYCFVDEQFHSRFSAKSRKYTYYLPKICSAQQLQNLGQILIGTHDFRFFCVQKPNVNNFVRTIYSFTVDEHEQFLAVKITGSAFLYHQIRCTMSVLSLVICGTLSEETMKKWLKPEGIKPFYRIAPAELLQFCGVEYDEGWKLNWKKNVVQRYIDRDEQQKGEISFIGLAQGEMWKGDPVGWFLDQIGKDDKRVGQILATK